MKRKSKATLAVDNALLEDVLTSAVNEDELPDQLEDLEKEARYVELSLPNVHIKIVL